MRNAQLLNSGVVIAVVVAGLRFTEKTYDQINECYLITNYRCFILMAEEYYYGHQSNCINKILS